MFLEGQQRTHKTLFHLIQFVITKLRISFPLLLLNAITAQRYLKQLCSQQFSLRHQKSDCNARIQFWEGRENPPRALPERKWTSPAVFLEWWIGLNTLGNAAYFLDLLQQAYKSQNSALCLPKSLKFRLKAIRTHLYCWCTHHGVGSASQEHIL